MQGLKLSSANPQRRCAVVTQKSKQAAVAHRSIPNLTFLGGARDARVGLVPGPVVDRDGEALLGDVEGQVLAHDGQADEADGGHGGGGAGEEKEKKRKREKRSEKKKVRRGRKKDEKRELGRKKEMLLPHAGML